MSVPNEQQRQVMLSLAYLAYCGELITSPDPEQTILQYINDAMPQIPPLSAPNDTWKVVWGPVTYTVPGARYQENLMFVAQDQRHPDRFAIAIRGTNSIADIDWLMEDFDILDTMNWPPGAPTPKPKDAKISESTSIGLNLLLLMKDKLASGTQTTLLEFLKSQAANPIHLCVTGHSLGGCLAGTMALYLKEHRSSWDTSGRSDVSCITFAAPTAGNKAFATHSDAQFNGKSGWPNWDQSLGTSCDTVRCDLDVAPKAWIARNLVHRTPDNAYVSPLFSIYGKDLDIASFGEWAIFVVPTVFPPIADVVAKEEYEQIESGAVPIKGTFNDKYKPTSNDGLMDYLKLFIKQAAYQHAESYPILLGVPQLNDGKIIKVE